MRNHASEKRKDPEHRTWMSHENSVDPRVAFCIHALNTHYDCMYSFPSECHNKISSSTIGSVMQLNRLP